MKLIHLALGGALILLGAALDKLHARRCHDRGSTLLDESLEGTYPASDPTATQDFTSPDERCAAAAQPSTERLH